MLQGDLPTVSDVALLEEIAASEARLRAVQAWVIRLAGEVGVRSRPELGDEGLSRSQNFTSPVALLATVTGASAKECKNRLDLGKRLRGEILLGGGEGPAPFPLVSEALDSGDLPIEAAATIVKRCGELADRGCSPDVVAGAEETLVERTLTCHFSADETAKMAIHLREILDPDGAEPRDEVHQQLRSLTIWQSSDGMVRGKFALAPEQGGIWMSSLQAMQSPRVSGPRFMEESDYVTADGRTSAQKNADTITELIARTAGAEDMPRLNGATTTLNLHVTLADLEAGRGVGYIDGLDEPVPASTVAQLRCSSPMAVTLFGDRGEVLFHGKTKRLFTPAQNRGTSCSRRRVRVAELRPATLVLRNPPRRRVGLRRPPTRQNRHRQRGSALPLPPLPPAQGAMEIGHAGWGPASDSASVE
ncbi:13E12 repeat family protein [Herbiconiux sp. CPCC 205716]|uniref:13E12 repeat family protein n=1 Tax=Herbiconiux gentiana TaxID=2970912 RepID=A0ABT2GF05_9MICO|nr:13E12 repeat family protein [Herbiconiux gentiana]MCS5714790.1 13E12 repeat family protein [Herbiconiux gentiana]